MPNMMPRVGRGKAANVFYNTGHGHLGWTLSAVTAAMIAEMIEQVTRNAQIQQLMAAPPLREQNA